MSLIIMLLWPMMYSTAPNRVLDIYTDYTTNNLYVDQLTELAKDKQGLKERDVVVKTHTGSAAFKVTLTGKDGGQKLNSTNLLTLKKLFAIIDAMPMRKEEMRIP